MLPLGVSAVTLGFGFLITLGSPPLDLRDSPLLIPVAQALVALPLVVRILVPVLVRRSTTGCGRPPRPSAPRPCARCSVVDLPVVWKPLLAAAGFAFACSLGEFGATSFLVRDDRPTLPVVIFRLIGHPGDLNYGMALAASVVLGAATAVVMLVVERLRVPVGGDAVTTEVALAVRGLSVSYDGEARRRRRRPRPRRGPGAGRARALRLRQVDPAPGDRRARGRHRAASRWHGTDLTPHADPQARASR